MQVKISTRHGQLNEATQGAIRDKAEKLVHYFDRITLIEITVDVKKTEEDKCRVEFVVQAEHKHNFVAHEMHHDVMAAVDLVMDKMQAQLRRHKEKLQDRRRTPHLGEVPGSSRQEAED